MQNLPSPTTGAFPAGDLAGNSSNSGNQQQSNIKQEHTHSTYSTGNRSWGSKGGSGPQSRNRASEDGFNWRKYGQKLVKGSENPRSYYKCTHPNCPARKQVERSFNGRITEIVYKSKHNHPKPEFTKRPSSSFRQSDSVVPTPENSSVTIVGEDDSDWISHEARSEHGDHFEFDERETDAKRWKSENEDEMVCGGGSKAVRDQRVVVQTISNIDKLDDGYWWRKYGQKVVKGNPNPRSYYKCTYEGCGVRKHIERASHDLRAVLTTYEGKHNHDIPASRGGGRSLHTNHANSGAAAAATAAMISHSKTSRSTDSETSGGYGFSEVGGAATFSGRYF